MIGSDIEHAGQLLKQGKLVAIPTETVYGLAANALDPDAVLNVFRVKKRPHFDPLIIHLSQWEQALEYTEEIPDIFNDLAASFSPGPITFLLKKKPLLSDVLTSGSPFVAVRIPSHPIAHKLLSSIDFPLAAPSANPFGYISPTTAKHVEDQLGQDIPYILDGGPCHVGIESTIIGMTGGIPTIFRKGGLPIEKIKAITHKLLIKKSSSANPSAPGMLESHYAPKKRLILGDIDHLMQKYSNKRLGIMSFNKSYEVNEGQFTVTLSPSSNYNEAARNLFGFMRYLDGKDIDLILAELLPEEDLGLAINDRLRRAAFEKYR